MGTYVEVECDRLSEADAAFAAIEHVHRLMSAHDADSDLSRINCVAHRRSVAISAPTAEVLRRAMHWAEASGSTFDVIRAGRESLTRGGLPRHPGQPSPDPLADWRAISVKGKVVRLDRPACLDLGGIAKGYAVDLAIDAMRSAGAAHGLVNAGGDLRVFGDRPRSIAVPDPRSRLPLVMTTLSNEALATSAGLPDDLGCLDFGHLHGSTLDWISVTVRAPNACDADALAKIVWALGPNSAKLLRDYKAEALIIDSERRVHAIGAVKVTA